MAANDKDTIYIDVDDEITGIIDKVHGSDGKVVALVLPKRASVFQSIVNMKLLKRAADSSKKHLVLITSEAGLLPLAGVAGVHVAKTLTSKPEIPSGPGPLDDHEETVSEDEAELEPEITAETAGDEPIGKLAAGAGAGALAASAKDDMETLVLDDDDLPPESELPSPKNFDVPDKPKKGKNKGLKIPNFERFRLLLALGALLLIALIVGAVFAATALPKATITIDTNAVNVDSNLNLNLSTTAKTVNLEDNSLPAKFQQQQKTSTQTAVTTGQKNNGDKAVGKVKFINCSPGDSAVIPAGTGISTTAGQTYVTKEDASMPVGSNSCKDLPGATSTVVAAVAVSGGADYNLGSGTSLKVASSQSSAYSPSSIKASVGEAFTGGTDNIVHSVNQNDINSAKAKINVDDPSIKQDLQDQLKEAGYFSIVATYSAGTPAVTTSASVGQVADNVTVTEIVTYTMFGVRESDLTALIDNSVKTQIDPSKQTILSRGLDKAKFSVTNASTTGAQIAMSTVATAGPDLDKETIKKDAAGQHPGEIKDSLKNRPGVKNVSVKLSPFWVSTVPKKTDRIVITIAEPKATVNKSNAANP